MPAKKRHRISRADVARAAEVAPCTVSLVLNNNPKARVREEVRKRIREAAAELGYRPSATARALVTGRTNSIGVVIFQGGNPFDVYTNGILSTFWKKMHSKKYRMVLDSIEMDGDAAEYFIDHVTDGVLLMAPPREVKNLDLMREANFPVVCVGNIPDCDNVDYVDLDNYTASKEITRYLIEQGHTKIAHIAGVLEDSSTAVSRLTGYRDALEEAGIKYDPGMVTHSAFIYEGGKTATVELLARQKDFTAIFTATGEMSYGAIDELSANGLKVPDDISVATIKLVSKVIGRRCEITGIINPLKDIGTAAADILFQRINGLKDAPSEQKFHGELFVGNTVKKIR
jgi:LacI family transcriptional regulator, galactose operon repressor